MSHDILRLPYDTFGIWHETYFFGLSGIVLLGLYRFRPQIGWAALLLWYYVLIRALYLSEFPGLDYGEYHLAYEATAGQAFIEALLLPLFALSLSKAGVLRAFRWGLPWLVAFQIGVVWLHRDGLMIAPSFNLALLALCLPLVSPWLWAPILLTVASFHGGTAQLMMGAIFLTWAIRWARTWQSRLGWALLAALGLILAKIHEHGPLLSGEGRLAGYRLYMGVWAGDWRSIVWGSGPGSFLWMGPLIAGMKGEFFLHLHSDWLQIPFELGVVGLVLALGVLYRAVRESWGEPRILAGVVGLAAFATTYHPARFFPTALLAALILRLALSRRD
jgi:hypothetical protein